MKSIFKNVLCGICILCASLTFFTEAKAEYPNKPITIIVPYGAGGDSDMSARAWAEFAKKELGQPVLVVNKVGGGGLTGTLAAAKAKPDGYTLFLGQAGPTIILPLMTNVGGLSVDSFDYLVRFLKANTAVVALKDAPWSNLKEFAEAAKKEPGKYVFASMSANSWATLAMRDWMKKQDLDIKILETNSGAEAMSKVLGGHADFTFLFPNNWVPNVKADKLKILAIGAKSTDYPAPTFEELGYAGEYFGWSAITVPTGVPQDIKDKLVEVSQKVSKNPDFIKVIENMGMSPDFTVGNEFYDQVQSQHTDLKTLIDSLGIGLKKK